MIDLKKIIGGQEVVRWFEFEDGFELKIAYMPLPKGKSIWRMQGSERAREKAWFEYAVRDWRGLTVEKFCDLCVVDKSQYSPEELAKEVPFSIDQFIALVGQLYDLAEFVGSTSRNHQLYKPTMEKPAKAPDVPAAAPPVKENTEKTPTVPAAAPPVGEVAGDTQKDKEGVA